MLIAREKPGFQALSKGLIVLLCAEVVQQGVCLILLFCMV